MTAYQYVARVLPADANLEAIGRAHGRSGGRTRNRRSRSSRGSRGVREATEGT
jgi:hypothetical protein